MIDIDISDPKIDPMELFCQFAYDRLLWWSSSRMVFWGLMELWSWSLGPPTPFSKDPIQSMQEEEDLKIFSCLASAIGIGNMHLEDVVILAEAWVAAGLVSKESDTFIITNEGRKILEIYRPEYVDPMPKIRF